MSLHINRFLDRVRTAESRQQRDVTMTVIEAKDLHADITRLLLLIEQLRQPVGSPDSANNTVMQIEIKGEDF